MCRRKKDEVRGQNYNRQGKDSEEMKGMCVLRDGKPTLSGDFVFILGRHRVVQTPKLQETHRFRRSEGGPGPWSGRCFTCGELGGERVHFLVHHLLVQGPQAERLHRERQGPGQHGIHVHTSERRDTPERETGRRAGKRKTGRPGAWAAGPCHPHGPPAPLHRLLERSALP